MALGYRLPRSIPDTRCLPDHGHRPLENLIAISAVKEA